MATSFSATGPRMSNRDGLCDTVARECGIPRHLFDGSRDNHATTAAVFRRLHEMAVQRFAGAPGPPHDDPEEDR